MATVRFRPRTSRRRRSTRTRSTPTWWWRTRSTSETSESSDRPAALTPDERCPNEPSSRTLFPYARTRSSGSRATQRAGESVRERSREGIRMVNRKIFPAYGGYDIAVASEQMRDGKWLAVASVTHSTNSSRRAIDLPVPSERFESEEDAE